jgi:hypothetical protein
MNSLCNHASDKCNENEEMSEGKHKKIRTSRSEIVIVVKFYTLQIRSLEREKKEQKASVTARDVGQLYTPRCRGITGARGVIIPCIN